MLLLGPETVARMEPENFRKPERIKNEEGSHAHSMRGGVRVKALKTKRCVWGGKHQCKKVGRLELI